MDKNKIRALMNIKNAKELYVIMSKCTRLPFVNCNEETFDDEVFIYINEEAGKRDVTELAKKDELVDLIEVSQKNALGFFSSLLTIGVNSVHLDKGTKDDISLQLNEIVNRTNAKESKDEMERVENPQFQLTAIYYMQKIRKNPKMEMTEEIRELQEEMLVHFWEGKLLLAVQEEGNGIPLLRKNDGKAYQPVFTDAFEFQKFCAVNPNVKFKAMKMEAEKLPLALTKEAAGAAVNPFGVNLQIEIRRKETSAS